MTISSTSSKVSFNGSGSTGPFSIPYKFSKNADLAVTKVSTAGVASTLALTTNYTLTGAGAPSGGTLTLLVALAAGERLIIKRSPAKVQETDYVENASFPAKAHEDALDLLTMVSQDLQEQIDRSVKVGIGSTTDPAALIANLEASAPAAAASASAAATSASAAAASAAVALAASGRVKVSANDTTHGDLETKLLAGTGILLSTQNEGASETRTVAVDVGTSAGKIPVLDAGGKLVRSIIPSSIDGVDQAARDNAAMTAFIARIQAGRATGPVPGGGIWMFVTDELTKGGGARYDSANKWYTNTGAVTAITGMTATADTTTGGYPASNMVDGNTSTMWLSATITPQSVVFAFGAAKNVSGYDLFAPPGFVERAAAGWTVDLLIGGSWVLGVDSRSGIVAWVAGTAKSFTLSQTYANATQMRINMTTAQAGANLWGYAEVTIYNTDPTTAMTLTTPAGIALGSVPTKATMYLLHKSVDALTYNTDIIVKASRIAVWANAANLAALCQFDANYKLLRATIDLSALVSGSTGLWSIETSNKSQHVGPVLAWFE